MYGGERDIAISANCRVCKRRVQRIKRHIGEQFISALVSFCDCDQEFQLALPARMIVKVGLQDRPIETLDTCDLSARRLTLVSGLKQMCEANQLGLVGGSSGKKFQLLKKRGLRFCRPEFF